MYRRIKRTLVALLLVLTCSAAHAATSRVPWQFIARLYTEALGRAPDQAGYQTRINYFNSAGCNTTSLSTAASSFYLSTEYNGLGYDNASKLLTLYRGLLKREPDMAGFNYLYGLLQSNSISWATVVGNTISSAEFQALIPQICTDQPYGWLSNGRPIPLPTSPTTLAFTGGTGAALQAVLNAASPGSTVLLAQKAVVYATSTLTVPAGVTLRTESTPLRTSYASMGRIVRDGPTGATYSLVSMATGSSLFNVWVEGRAGAPTSYPIADNGNIAIAGANVTVSNNRSSDNAGHYAIGFLPIAGNTCDNVVITNNLVTAFANNRGNMSTDGLQLACVGVTATHNEVVEVPDIGAVLFAVNGTSSHATISQNIFFNAAMPANGAVGIEPMQYPTAMPNFDFTGVSVDHNIVWTAPSGAVFSDIVFSVGTRAWWGIPGFPTGAGVGISRTGNGGSWRFNTTDDGTGSPQKSYSSSGFLVSGEVGVTITNNTLSLNIQKWTFNCPLGALVVSSTPSYASGVFDQPVTYATDRQNPAAPTAPYIDGCVWR